MKVGIVGLGLIGGSLAKAFKRNGDKVAATDIDRKTLAFAILDGSVDVELTSDNMSDMDLILLAIRPKSAVKWVEDNADCISKDTLVIDCCGTKRYVCEKLYGLAEEKGLLYMGGHPMAGKERGGYKNSSADLFDEEPFILVPKDHNDIALLCKAKNGLQRAGFGRFTVTTPEEHDRVIAYTSQMPHIVSNAFIKSSTALVKSKAISAGSFLDFTRVAFLDENMWAELFIENREYLGSELKKLAAELSKYAKALEDEDEESLKELLADGKRCKEAADEACR